MEIKEIKEKAVWENFLLGCQEKSFLDSWNWGEFQKMMGNKIWRLGIFENRGGPSSTALAVEIKAKRGMFLFVPHGPALLRSTGNPKSEILNPKQIQNSKFQILKTLLEELKKIAKEERASFIRIAPILEKNEENLNIFKNSGFIDAPIHMHPEVTWELDVTPSEENLLAKMRKTTRYLIRQAQKNKDIEISPSQNLKDVEEFNELYQETVDRHHFTPFSLDYLKNEFQAFLPDNQVSLFFAKYKEEILASAMIIFWQNIAFYHQGASTTRYPRIPAAYLLQWELIKEAKKRGCKTYNFWGIAEQNQKSKIKNQKFEIGKHPWAGLTLFKMGFGGYKKEYVKTQDLPLSKRYWLTYLFEKLRRAKRGL